MITKPPKTPTLNRIRDVQDESQLIGEFLDWLGSKYVLCVMCDEDFMPARVNTDALLHDYFGIDSDAEEKERRALLDWQRKETT